MNTSRWLRAHPEDGGAPSTQAAMLFPVIMLVLVAVVAGGRVSNAHDAADQAARAASRIASIQPDPNLAQSASTGAATAELAAQGLRCAAVTVTVDTAGLSAPLGQPATVAACVVVAPARSGKSNPPGLVLVTAHKADLLLCGAGVEVQRS